MTTRRLRFLLIGLGMFIIGPAIGYGTTIFLWFRLTANSASPTFSLTEVVARFSQLPGEMVTCLIPVALGGLTGAIGLFLFLANAIIYAFGSDSPPQSWNPQYASTPRSAPTPSPRPTAPAVFDDSRYMPKSR